MHPLIWLSLTFCHASNALKLLHVSGLLRPPSCLLGDGLSWQQMWPVRYSPQSLHWPPMLQQLLLFCCDSSSVAPVPSVWIDRERKRERERLTDMQLRMPHSEARELKQLAVL